MPARLCRYPLGLFLALLPFLAALAQPIDDRDLDTSTPACSDFYQHANGGWLARTPIPDGFASWGTFEEIGLQGVLQQRALLEAAARSEQPLERLVGALYASGMDEAAIEQAAAGPLRALLRHVERIRRQRDVLPTIAVLHQHGIPALFDFGANDDLHNPARRIAYANQGGLGLADRDYYLRDDEETRLLRAAYEAYVERLLTLSGAPDPARAASWVLAMETRLARASLSLLELRDPARSYQLVSVQGIQRTYPALAWPRFLKDQGLNKLAELSLAHADFFREADALLAEAPVEHWRAYLRFHVAHAMAPYLSSGFVEAHDAVYLRTLQGSQEPMPRWRRVRRAVDALLGPALGHLYLQAHFPPAARSAAEDLVERVRASLRSQLAEAPWLGSQSRLAALEKIDSIDIKLGGIDTAPKYEGLKPGTGIYAENVLAIAAWLHRQQMASIGKVREEWQWPQPAHAVNLYYDPARNQLVVPAGMMQPPLFDPGGDPALNFGALGTLVAHELMHGFDANGSRFDAQGRIKPWWDAADLNGFNSRFEALKAQYDAYPALGRVMVNGRLTLPENIADLAGVQIARLALDGLGALPDVGPFPAVQRFYLAYARTWRRNHRDTELQLRSRIDVRAPPRWRVNGPLANLDDFASAFACKAGAGSMVRPKEQRISVF